MADKSLFDIAKELYQGFGNNPANRELANTLTFRAPVVRELNPLVTVPRGINTLRDTDYGAIKDFLTGKYQIANDPRASLQRAGQATMNLGEGALDAAPVLGAVKPAIAGVKAAAPYVAEAGVRKLASLEEKYGLPTSPYLSVVKPEGNLNFAPRIKEQLKGPEKQSATSFFGQMKNMPGGSEQSLKEIVERIGDPTTVMTKEQFENSLNPSRYDKIDMTDYTGSNLEDLIQHHLDTAADYVDDADVFYNLGVPDQHQELVDGIMWGDLNYSELSARDKEAFRQYARVTEEELANRANLDQYFASRLDHAYTQAHHDVSYELATSAAEDDIANNGGDILNAGHTKWDTYQRLVPVDQQGYFEIGVMHPDYEGEYRHYSGAPKGTIGHVRGTLTQEPLTIAGGVEVPKNSYVVEEIQSDPQQSSAQKGPLRQVHGVLFKAAVQDAFEKGADRIYLPTSEAIVRPITRDRGEKSLDLYKRVYDKEVKQQGLDELASIPGVEVRPIAGLKPGTDDEVQYFYEITASPEAKDYLLKGEGFKTPTFAAGGMVASDYDEEQIDRMSDKIFNFAKGGKVSAEPRENEYVTKAARYGRKGQYQIANMLGMKPEVEFATVIPEKYFPANEQHNARGDAMRHMLLQAQLMQKYGETPAKIFGWMHENLSGPQGDAEQAMDEYNDRLGREIGRVATDKADMAYRALQAIEKQKAKTLTKEQMGEGYAEGGLVYNDEEINNLADQLLGA